MPLHSALFKVMFIRGTGPQEGRMSEVVTGCPSEILLRADIRRFALNMF
jgi:hypothetical protein